MCYSKNSKEWIVSGIVSFGPEAECGTGLPGVYTKVAYFKDWIDKVLDVHEKRTTSESEATSEILTNRRYSQDNYQDRHNCDRVEETTTPDDNSGHILQPNFIYILLHSLSIIGHRKYISFRSL